jgi:predicted hydrocarbon binding protein
MRLIYIYCIYMERGVMEDRLIENKAYRVILLGIKEIIGMNGLKSILNFSGLAKYSNTIPADDSQKSGPKISEVAQLSAGIEEIYGKNGARAILFQVGRMQAKWGLDENRDVSGAAKEAMAQMSESDRANVILTYTADTVTKQLNTETWIERDGEDYLYKDKSATHSFGRTSDVPVCHTTVGFLAELVAWAVGNNEWKVVETGCTAMGEPCCTYRISRR